MFAQFINRINRSSELQATTHADRVDVPRLPEVLTPDVVAFVHDVIDWIDAPLTYFDRDLHLRLANAAYCRLVDKQRDDVLGRPLDELSDAASVAVTRPYFERVLAGESIDIDIAHRNNGAMGGASRIEYRPQRNASGAVTGVFTVMHRLGRRDSDRTEPVERIEESGTFSAAMRAALRIAQDDLQERERKQRELIESIPLPIVFIGNDGLCKWANHAFCRDFAIAERIVAGATPAELSPEIAALIDPGLPRARAGERQAREQLFSQRDGAPRWYCVELIPGFDRDGAQSGVYALFSDIHDSQLAAMRLQESEAHFRGFTENIPESIAFIDRDRRYRYVNQAFLKLVGKPREQVIGRTVVEVLGSEVGEGCKEKFDRAIGGEYFVDQTVVDVGGKRGWREIRYLPFRNEQGAIEGLYVMSLSIEDTKQTQFALRERETRIRFLTDNLPAQITYLGADDRYQYCNNRFLTDNGLTDMTEVVGKTPLEVLGPAIEAVIRPQIAAAMRGERVQYERLVDPDASEPRWLRITLVGDFDEDGSARGMYGIAYDITDSKTAEQSRVRQQEWIEAFIENFPQPLSYVDGASVYQFANRAFADFIGRPKDEIIGMSGFDLFSREVVALFESSFRKAFAGERVHTEHEIPELLGGHRWIAIDWLPDFDATGKTRGIYFVAQDIGEAKIARQAYEESLREMQRAMDSVALPISFVDANEWIRFVNHTTTVWQGRSADELIGMPMRDLMSEDDYRFALPYIRAALGGEAVQYEREMRDHDGVRRWVWLRYVPTRDESGKVTGFYTTATDIQARKKQEIALQQANGLLTAHFENTPLASFTLDAGQRITRWSSQAETLLGWRRDEVFEKLFDDLQLIGIDLRPDFLPVDASANDAAGNSRLHLVETRRRDGTHVTCEWHIAALRDAAGRISSTLVLVQNVSQRVEAERRLTEIAQRDTLTRLLNRNALEPTLRTYIERARQNGTGVAVLFLDLDHFKNINDTLGHRVGDLMLVEIAGILRHCVRAEDEVARIGGDEFMIVIGHARPKAIAHETAQRITAALGTPIRVENQRLSVAASIGIAVYPDHGRAPEALVRSADLAMYRAKENGKNRFEFFSAALAQRSERRSAVKNALKIALQRDALRLYFQPRVRISDGKMVGAEALLRWTDPRLGVVSPKEFIGIAEESGLIHELGLFVFRKACRQLCDWQVRGIPVGVLSINFSAHQLLVATFIDEVDRVIEETGVDPRFVEVEITETSMLFDLGVTKNVIADLKHRGMRIAIDDFGTGFSSLSHLQQLEVDTLKIDQSFIRDMLIDAGDAAITSSVISLARGLGLSTTAEGVESEAQLKALRQSGCDYYQGFLFSPAIMVDDIEALLASEAADLG